jgi:hypothetical protein
LPPEQSGKVKYERERLLGIANKFIHLFAIPSSLSRSYSTFPLCYHITWNSPYILNICVVPNMFIYSPDLYLTNNFEQSVGLPVLVVPVITKIRLIEMHVYLKTTRRNSTVRAKALHFSILNYIINYKLYK